jgi:hypothetical protein
MSGDNVAGRLLRTWLLIGVVDFLFASCLSVFAYRGTFGGLWRGVASVPFGAEMLKAGERGVAIGIALHFAVAVLWSAVFVLGLAQLGFVRRLVASPAGVLAVAAVYGPLIWTVMSFVLIQAFTGRPPAVNFRWWVQFFAHIPFVALPIVWAGRPPRTG